MPYKSNRGIVEKVIAKNITEAVNETALNIQNQAKMNASGRPGPKVDTGMLRRSIRAEFAPPPISFFGFSFRTIEAKVIAGGMGGVDYAHYVEFGTKKMPPYPFMTPAIEAERGPHAARIEKAINP